MGDIFITGREMTHPYTSGKFKRDYTLDEMRQMSAEITEEEKQDFFYKNYYSEKLAELQEDHKRALKNGPLAPEACYLPEKAGEILLSGDSRYAENGYGVMSNGVGFAAVKIDQEGIADEMIKNYREHFAHTQNRNLFYKIWYPHMHVMHLEDAIIEDWGWGKCFQEMDMEAFHFSQIGISEDEIRKKDPDCLFLIGFGGNTIELDNPKRKPWFMAMVQHTRQTSWGRELRVRYWNGLTFKKDGSTIIQANPDHEQTLREMRMMHHCQQEYCNELALIKKFWKDTH